MEIVMKSKGFTLLELMIVVAIIGILASVALPQYSLYINRAKITDGLALIAPLKAEIADYYIEHGSFPADNQALKVAAADQFIGNYVRSVSVDDGAINIELGNKVAKQLDGKHLSIRPIYVAGNALLPVSWLCGNSELIKGMSVSGENITDVPEDILLSECK